MNNELGTVTVTDSSLKMAFHEIFSELFEAGCNIGHLRLWFNIPADTNTLWSERTTSKVISSLHCNPRENYFSREQMVLVSSLTATKTNWGETFNQEHKENC